VKKETPENRVKAEVLDYLSARRIFAWSNPTGTARVRENAYISFGKKGSSDIIGILPDGRFLAVECKAENGKLSLYQKEFLAAVAEKGGLAVVAYSFADVESVLKREGYC
jgi:hypothetical protein